jgi:hypothetical protein
MNSGHIGGTKLAWEGRTCLGFAVPALVRARFEVAEDTRFELVRACTQPAFQASAIGL